MNADHHEQEPHDRMRDLLAAGAEAEMRLLRKERKAERRLADAEDALARDKARLRKLKQQIERSRQAVSAAQDTLREAQASRAAGPVRGQD